MIVDIGHRLAVRQILAVLRPLLRVIADVEVAIHLAEICVAADDEVNERIVLLLEVPDAL